MENYIQHTESVQHC